MFLEFAYDEHTIISGDVIEIHDKFSHEFGAENIVSHDVKNFSVVTYIDNIDYDITSCIENEYIKLYESLKEHLITAYIGIERGDNNYND